MKLAIILGTVSAAVLAVAGFVVLTYVGKDTASYVTFISAAAVFLVPHIMSLVNNQQTKSDISEIKERTNGPLTKMQRQIDAIALQVTEVSQNLKEHLKGGNNAGNP